MSGHLKAFVAILVIGVVGIVAARFLLPGIQDAYQRATSDSASLRGSLRVGVDSWVGYFPLCSPEMDTRLRHAGYAIQCIDDRADYDARFRALAKGELDLAVATVDAYLVAGSAHDFPGAIIAVIDESKGGDALIARKDRVASIEAMRARKDLRIAFTADSPSEHLLRAIATHFDLPQLADAKGRWRVAADGSEDALDQLRGGKVDAAVLWEPDVTRALTDPAHVKLIGTEDTEGLIVDILLASRRVLQEQPEALKALLEQYFATLHHYAERRGELREDLEDAADVSEKQADAMLKGVRWATLNDNGAAWFGITPSGLPGQEGLVRVIRSTVQVLRDAGTVRGDPLPAGDPYRITYRQLIGDLYLAATPQAGNAAQGDSLARDFAPLDAAGWARLRPIGTLKVEPVGFSRGTALLDAEGRATLDRMATRLRHYPNFRVVVSGHSGLRGDRDANVELSRQRAEAVTDYLLSAYPLDADRILAVGYGPSRPLPREEGETDRGYEYRLPRVEIALVGDAY